MVTVNAGSTVVTFEDDVLSVRTGSRTLARGPVVLETSAGSVPRDEDESSGVTDTATDGSVTTVERTFDGPLSLTVRLTPREAAVDVVLAVENRGDDPVSLDAFRWRATRTDFGPWTRVFEHGYASWSPTGVLRVGERFHADPDHLAPLTVDPAASPDRRSSHAFVGFAEPDAALTMGFLDGSRYVTRFESDDDAGGLHAFDAVCPADGVRVAPGERRTSAPLRLDASRDLAAGVRSLAAAVGERMAGRRGSTPTGWCSWYQYGEEVSPDDVGEARTALSELGLPVDVVQVDDGYQSAWGDWDGAAGWNPGAVAGDLSADGFTPGLWLAPFAVEAGSSLATDHPEWLLTRGGEPVSAGEPHRRLHGLDVTHPEAEAWLRTVVSRAVHDWGFGYLKLDFLYAGALAADRYDTVTRAEAYRRGLRAIREAAGPDATLLGCGAPMAPSVGLVEAMRVGPDVAPAWRGDRPSAPATRNAVRNVLSRSVLHRHWWVNDPDCLLLRESTDLTDAERRSFAALVAFTGGSVFVSDRLADLSPAGRSLLEATLPPCRGGAVHPLDADVWPDRVVHPRTGGVAVAAFNWGDEPTAVRVDPETYDAEAGWDFFAGVRVDDPVERDVSPHGCLVVHLATRADDGRPRVLGARDHLVALGGRLGTEWDPDRETLDLSLEARRPVTVVLDTGGASVTASGGPTDTVDRTAPATPTRLDARTYSLTLSPGTTRVRLGDE